MCAKEVKTKIYKKKIEKAHHLLEKCKEEKKRNDKTPLMDPAYIYWIGLFWPIY